jgi:hypothetical protein
MKKSETMDELTHEVILWMTYPAFIIAEGRGVIPDVRLPHDFEKRVPKFYEQGRKKDVESYVQEIRSTLGRKNLTGEFPEIRLQWDDKQGLTNISVGVQGGLDLIISGGLPRFQEHNLGGEAGYAAGFVAMQYVSELLKS